MLEKIIASIIEGLLEKLPAEEVRRAVDAGLDKLEKMVEESDTMIDDMIVLPLIKKAIREPFGIEDND